MRGGVTFESNESIFPSLFLYLKNNNNSNLSERYGTAVGGLGLAKNKKVPTHIHAQKVVGNLKNDYIIARIGNNTRLISFERGNTEFIEDGGFGIY